MKKLSILLFSILLTVSSCGGKKTDEKDLNSTVQETNSDTIAQLPQQTKAEVVKKEITDVYFKANGTEPFWSLTISEKMIKLKTIDDSIMTPHTVPTYALDSNVKLYALHTEMVKMNIQISSTECINAMSGMASPYTVHVELMKGRETEFTKLEGCGEYITDYRLHDLWVLETIDGNQVTKEQFEKDLPYMEINSASNSFMGYAGCNKMNGKLFSEYNLLRFVDIATTKKMCPNNLEDKFLDNLKAATSYKIENNRLWLSNPDKELLVLKKID